MNAQRADPSSAHWGFRCRLEEAETHARMALQICQTHFDAKDLTMATTHNALGRVLRKQGNLPGACAHYKEVVGVLEWNHGDTGEHAQWLAVALFNLGTLLADCHITHFPPEDAGSSQQALDYLERAWDLACTLPSHDNAEQFSQVFNFYSRKLASDKICPFPLRQPAFADQARQRNRYCGGGVRGVRCRRGAHLGDIPEGVSLGFSSQAARCKTQQAACNLVCI